jgi:hypothetical protein
MLKNNNCDTRLVRRHPPFLPQDFWGAASNFNFKPRKKKPTHIACDLAMEIPADPVQGQPSFYRDFSLSDTVRFIVCLLFINMRTYTEAGKKICGYSTAQTTTSFVLFGLTRSFVFLTSATRVWIILPRLSNNRNDSI